MQGSNLPWNCVMAEAVYITQPQYSVALYDKYILGINKKKPFNKI